MAAAKEILNTEGVKHKVQEEPGVAAGLSRGIVTAVARVFGNPAKVFKPYKSGAFEIVRGRLAHNGTHVEGAGNIFKHALQKEGRLNFCKYTLGPLAGDAVLGAMMFTVYLETLTKLDSKLPPGAPLHLPNVLAAGAIAGFSQGTVAAPLEIVLFRTRHHHPNPFKLQGLSRGLAATVTRDTLGVSIFFSVYESVKSRAEFLSSVIIAGSCAGATYRLLHLPFHHVKEQILAKSSSHLQPGLALSTPGYLRTAKSMVKTNGIKSLFTGARRSLFRAMPPSVLGLIVFEWAKGVWDLDHEQDCHSLNCRSPEH